MIKLNTRGTVRNLQKPIMGTVADPNYKAGDIYLIQTDEDLNDLFSVNRNYKVYLVDRKLKNSTAVESITDASVLYNINTEHLAAGDIIVVNPDGKVSTLFRKQSQHNSLFITDRCNSNCLMCSQPPRNKDDLDYFFQLNKELISMIPKDTELLGITGGEPTLLGSRFIELLHQLKADLPATTIHVLSNGRSFAWKNYVGKIAEVDNQNVVFGIPLYSDYYKVHDYIVQARNAFDQTILGLYNLARFGQRIELRIVLHKQSYIRLPQLARFIYRNFPFVEHVAFMGLEYVGYTLLHHDKLWMEPSEYMEHLKEAALYLDSLGINVSIYNLQHCLLAPSLWKFSKKSISDWKQDYLDECLNCNKINECGGVFATSKKLSQEIKAFVD